MKTIAIVVLGLVAVLSGLYMVGADSEDRGSVLLEEQQGEPFMISNAAKVKIYDGISVSKNTTEVDLSGRGLSGSLKAEVRELSNLRVLDLSGNNFTGLPAEVGQLSKLEVLNLNNNPITGLPHELGNLKNLKTLDVRGTQYSEFDLDKISAALPAQTEILAW